MSGVRGGMAAYLGTTDERRSAAARLGHRRRAEWLRRVRLWEAAHPGEPVPFDRLRTDVRRDVKGEL